MPLSFLLLWLSLLSLSLVVSVVGVVAFVICVYLCVVVDVQRRYRFETSHVTQQDITARSSVLIHARFTRIPTGDMTQMSPGHVRITSITLNGSGSW